MELKKVPEEITDVIEGAGSLGMPGELGSLPGSQFAVQLMFDLRQLRPQFADLILGANFPEGEAASFSIFSSISRIGFSNSR